MASLNRGFIIEERDFDKTNLRDIVKEVFMKLEGIEDVLFFTDDEITNTAITLAENISKAMEKYKQGIIEVDKEDMFSDPEFIKRFNATLVLNVKRDEERGEKFFAIDRSNARNVTDTELLQVYAGICKRSKINMMLHIPSASDKRSQIDCFFRKDDMSVRVEQLGVGAPIVVLHVCTMLTPEEIEASENKNVDKKIATVKVPYGSIAEMYDDMLAFILDYPDYVTLYAGISRFAEDKIIPVECKNLEELYNNLSMMHAQIGPYGVEESKLLQLDTTATTSQQS